MFAVALLNRYYLHGYTSLYVHFILSSRREHKQSPRNESFYDVVYNFFFIASPSWFLLVETRNANHGKSHRIWVPTFSSFLLLSSPCSLFNSFWNRKRNQNMMILSWKGEHLDGEAFSSSAYGFIIEITLLLEVKYYPNFELFDILCFVTDYNN